MKQLYLLLAICLAFIKAEGQVVVKAEYFWDNDPGIGSGTVITIGSASQQDSVNITQTISTVGLSAGTHILYIRTKDSNGRWSLSEGTVVNVLPIIAAAEYFWDTDPGIGNGSGINVASPSDSVSLTKTFTPSALSALGSGIHYLYVRTKDSEGKWSLSEGQPVNVLPVITTAEVFWDTDPGIGNGTSISVGAHLDSVSVNVVSTALSTAGLSAGVHYFYVRTKDSGNYWSLSEGRAVNVVPYIVKGEYFFNTDPGIGNGTVAFTVPSANYADSIAGSYTVNPGLLPYRRHYHYLRTMDNFGKWSLSEPMPFDVEMHITKVEYFFDTDPGVGSGTDIPITPNDTVILSNYPVSTAALTEGIHNIYIRALNDAGVWTPIDQRTFYVEPAPLTYTNTHVEYFIDTDPGVGLATDIPIADGDTLSLINAPASVAGYGAGVHQLYIRTKNSLGVWSVIDQKSFFIDEPLQPVTAITQLEYFYNTDPGTGNGINLPLPGALNDTVIINTSITLPCLANGTNYMWLRAKNNLGVWSVVDYDTLNVSTIVAKSIISTGSDTVCFPNTVTMHADSAAGITYQWFNNSSPISGATYATYTATATGNYSLRQTCNAGVATSNIKYVVINNIPDITYCPSVSPVSNTMGLCSAVVTYPAATAIGSSPLPAITYSQNSGSSFPVGSTTVYVVATNLCGVDSCQFNIVVNDTEVPVISNCPADINLNSSLAACDTIATWASPTVNDNCGIQSFTSTHNTGSTFPVGTTTVTYTATDIHGNTNTCSFDVIVTDSVLPIFSNCPSNVTVSNTTGLCTGIAAWSVPAATDNCGIQSVTSTHNSGDTFPVGVTTVTYTVTDVNGNVNTCSFTVTVADAEVPVITCPANIVTCSGVVNFTINVTDNCGIQSMVSTPPSGSTFAVGTTTVNSVVTDINGNVSNCSFTVTVSMPSIPLVSAISDAPYNNICIGNSANLTVNGGSLGTGATWQWYSGSCGGTAVGTGTTISVAPTTTTTYFVRAEGGCGNTSCVSVSITVSTSPVSALPLVPFVGMPGNVCNGTTATLSVPAVNRATFYTWDAPTGSYFSGNPLNVSPFITTTPSVTVTFGNPGGSLYSVGVQAGNSCGSSIRQAQKVRGSTSVPASVSGPLTACANATITYSTVAVTGASSYLWTITGDATISGTGTTTTVTFGPAWNGGTLCVAAQTSCYTSPTKCITLSKSASLLNAISGTFTACPNSTLMYSVPASSGAASYTWTTPTGSTIATGQGTNSVSVNFAPGYSAVGSICVSVTSTCGVTSAQKCKTVAPGLPSQPNSISGALAGLCNQTVAYNCPSLGAGVAYNWTSPGIIIGGQGSTSITTSFTGLTTGNVCVTASNSCGSSTARCVPVKGAPNTPGAITASPSSWCANTAGIEFNVSTAALTGSYALSWAYPSASVVTYAFGGGNSTSLILDWKTGSGSVNVTASNTCGGATKTSTWSSTCREGEIGAVSSIKVSPNPTTGVVNVNYTASKGNTVINVLDLAGRVVMTQTISSVDGANTMQLDMSKLAKGAYMLSAQNKQDNKQVKVVVE